jgi:hypothetical protein
MVTEVFKLIGGGKRELVSGSRAAATGS